MAEQRNRWNWEIPGFEPRKSVEREEPSPPAQSLVRCYSVSVASVVQLADPARLAVSAKVLKLRDQVKHAKNDYLELRQEASDLQEYSNAKLERVTRYLGVFAERARKLDLAALETESKIAPLISEKKRLFNDLLTTNGTGGFYNLSFHLVLVFCRSRPLFEDEGNSVVEFPDEYTVRVTSGDDPVANPKDFQFDRVYGPHVSQGELFLDIQPFVQSALDGYNISLFAYGQTNSGKTYTMEGSVIDCGLYMRSFEELYDLSNLDTTLTTRFKFYVTAIEHYNEQVQDLLLDAEKDLPKAQMGTADYYVELAQEKVENPLEFSRILKSAILSRGNDRSGCQTSHLIITIHIHYNNWVTKENAYSKLSLIDLAGSDVILEEDASGDRVTDLLHRMKSLSALGDVLSSLSSKKDIIPYENSVLTKLLADSLGGNAKCLMIVTICPNRSNVKETVSSLNFSSRACSAELSLGNWDTIKKWRDVANDTRKELYEREKEIHDPKQEVLGLKQALKEANDQCSLLSSEVQKSWKVSSTLQSDLKAENLLLADKLKIEKEQNSELRNLVAHLLQLEQDQKIQIQERDLNIQTLQAKIKKLEKQHSDTLQSSDARLTHGSESGSNSLLSTLKSSGDTADSLTVTKKLEEELSKRDALIERLHEENERLFDRLTEKASLTGSTQVSSRSSREPVSLQSKDMGRSNSRMANSVESFPLTLPPDKTDITSSALVKLGPEKTKSTPAGEYLTAALMEFDPDQYDNPAAVADGANKLLMLVLAAVIKAGAAREHEILAEIRDAIFSFIHKMEPRRVMDTMLVFRVRILYIRSLIARSPELQSIKVSPVERFLEKANSGRSRSSSRSSSPGRSPMRYDSSSRNALVEEHVHGFKVNIKQEKKSKFSSIVLKLRGIDEETWKQHVTGGKLREITEEAKSFAIGNKALGTLFVHTPAGELQRQIRSWLAENFDFLSVTGADAIGGATGQLELLSTGIMDGWMAGLGAAVPPTTDALGQRLSEYAKRVYTSQLQHLKDIAGTLATEEAEDLAQVHKLRSALESVSHKRRRILQQMKNDVALLTIEQGGSPIYNPPTSSEDARLASLISLDGILKQVKDIIKQTSLSSLSKSRKKALLISVDELLERMPSLLDVDHPCAQRQIEEARAIVEAVPDVDDPSVEDTRPTPSGADWGSTQETEVSQWNVLQFNTGSTSPFIIKCGANSNSELVIKANAKVQDPKGSEIIRVAPRPLVLDDMNLEEIKHVFSQLPEALSLLSLARTADGTRARYSRLYRTLAMKVPSLRDLVSELEKGGALKDVRS